jgi:hypothetical protein
MIHRVGSLFGVRFSQASLAEGIQEVPHQLPQGREITKAPEKRQLIFQFHHVLDRGVMAFALSLMDVSRALEAASYEPATLQKGYYRVL